MRSPSRRAAATSVRPPVTMPSINAQSATHRAIGPAVSRVCDIGTIPHVEKTALISLRFLAGLSNYQKSLTLPVHRLILAIAAIASFFWFAPRVYLRTSFKLVWPVTDAI